MTDLDALAAAFDAKPPAPPEPRSATSSPPYTSDAYERRLRSLLLAEGGKYQRALAGDHAYPSDSEADLGVLDAMVLRHFTDTEIWATLDPSVLFARRAEKKGERHARNLFAAEIGKARAKVQPFATDPGRAVPRPERRRQAKQAATQAQAADAAQRETAAPDLWRDDRPPPTGDDFVSQYVRYALQRTDAPQAAHELLAFIVLSALAGPGPVLPIATSHQGWRLCLWGMYIVNSTSGRKTTTINIAKEVLEEILGAAALIEWEGSPQGLIQKLQSRDGKTCVFARDEYSGLMAQMNRNGGHLAGLPQVFIKAFDGGVIENIRTRKRKGKNGPWVEDTDRVSCPYLPKLTASTWDSFVQRCSIDNVLDGYLTRFIFVTGQATPRPLAIQTPALINARDQLVEAAARFQRKAAQLEFLGLDAEVLAAAWTIEQQWLEVAEQSSRPDAAGPAAKRLLEAVIKVAALIAIDATPMDSVPRVTPAHFARALELGERWRESTMAVIEALGATSFMRDVEAVLATVIAHPTGIAVRDLLRKHRRLRQRDFDEILETLERREEIVRCQLETGRRGRRPVLVYPFDHAPEGPEP